MWMKMAQRKRHKGVGDGGSVGSQAVPTRAEVVVVGGGCMGAGIAFHLARRGRRGVHPQRAAPAGAAVAPDPDAGYADPIATANGFAHGAAREGARILEGRETREILVKKERVAGV